MNINTYNLSSEIMANVTSHKWGVVELSEAIDKNNTAHDDAIRRECDTNVQDTLTICGVHKDAGIRKVLSIAILGTEPTPIMHDLEPKVADCVQKNFSELIGTEPAREERNPE